MAHLETAKELDLRLTCAANEYAERVAQESDMRWFSWWYDYTLYQGVRFGLKAAFIAGALWQKGLIK